jgi:hypothetical protein
MQFAQKAQKLTKDSIIAEGEYRSAVDNLRQYQPVWEDKLTGIYKFLQQQEEQRIDAMKAYFVSLIKALEEGSNFVADSTKRMNEAVNRVNRDLDISEFVRDNHTGPDKPPVPAFVPYVSDVSPTVDYAPSFQSAPASAPVSTQMSSPTSMSQASGPGAKRPPPAGARPPPPRSLGNCQALYDYVGQDASELDFFAGDIVKIIKKDDSGWWVGEIDGRQGNFPSNYTQEV